MLLIRCPWCGPREETEFRYGGQAQVSYPPDPTALDDPSWGAYLFVRDNPLGWFLERYAHTQGCRQWFTIWRHTVTNQTVTNQTGTNQPGTNNHTADAELSHR